jgi:FtsH-binding integral membrane protein
MYNNNTDKDLLGAGLTAGLGAGIVTSFAVSQGQSPMIALAITTIAAIVGVLCRLYDLA